MIDQLFSVQGNVTIVSGGSRGIGKAIARGFAERGAKVVVTGRHQEVLAATAEEIQSDQAVMPVRCDVSNRDDIENLIEVVKSEHGRIDTLINVAGVNRRMPATQLAEEDYDWIMDINLKGAYLLSLAAGKVMIAQGSGCQINIGSLNNDRPLVGVMPYAISKAGLGQLTKALATEWGPKGVRVNGIAPGFILTDLTEKLWAQPDMQQWGLSNTPLNRLGQVDDMIGTAIFLASQASAFMTGQMLFVDGGFSSGLNWPIDYSDQ